jgi:hypothetical protein
MVPRVSERLEIQHHQKRCRLLHRSGAKLLFALRKDGTFILLRDERNPVFSRPGASGPVGLLPSLIELIPESVRHRIATITVQDVLRELDGQEWVTESRAKYALSQ